MFAIGGMIMEKKSGKEMFEELAVNFWTLVAATFLLGLVMNLMTG